MYVNLKEKATALKRLISELGGNVLETPVPFDKTDLTEHEKALIIDYCHNDVAGNILVFYNVNDKMGVPLETVFIQEKQTAEEYGMSMNWGSTSLVKRMFPNPIPKWHKHKILHKNTVQDPNFKVYPQKPSMSIGTLDIDLGVGGLHAVNRKYLGKVVENVHMLDYASMYPHIILQLDILEQYTPKYANIMINRFELKRNGDIAQLGEKLKINAISGQLKNEYSVLNDPFKSESMCYTGQQCCLYLIEQIMNYGFEIVQANTDGVAFVGNLTDEIKKEIMDKVSKTIEIDVEYDHFDRFIQSNVNTYCASKDGKVKSIGLLKSYNTSNILSKLNPTIIYIMVVHKLLFDIEFSETIEQYKNDLLLWTTTLYANSKWDYCLDDRNNVHQKTNRIVVTKGDGIRSLVKYNKNTNKTVLFSKLPNNFTIINDHLSKYNAHELNINYQWYIERATELYHSL